MPDSPQPEPDIAAYAAEAFGRMRDSSTRLLHEFNEWLAHTQTPMSVACTPHDEVVALDAEESIRRGLERGGKFIAIYRPCPKCQAEEVLRQKSNWLKNSGVEDENILHANFENFLARTPADEENREVAKHFAARKRGFLVFRGAVGLGKSHLAVAIMREVTGKAKFITQSRLLKKLRDTYNKDRAEDIIETCCSVRLLVLDEVGISAGGRDEKPMLHEILSTRHAQRRATVLTTNLMKDEELKEALGDRMFDRLDQSGLAILNFHGDSLRKMFRKDYGL